MPPVPDESFPRVTVKQYNPRNVPAVNPRDLVEKPLLTHTILDEAALEKTMKHWPFTDRHVLAVIKGEDVTLNIKEPGKSGIYKIVFTRDLYLGLKYLVKVYVKQP